jgi:hypothetical protein
MDSAEQSIGQDAPGGGQTDCAEWRGRMAENSNAIVDNSAYGLSVAEISEKFETLQDRVQAILACAQSHRVAHPVR